MKARRILAEVAQGHGLSVFDLTGKTQFAHIARARHEAMFRIYRETRLSSVQVGALLNRDHSTVLYGIRKHAERAG